ncbi:MAG: hypothetical protein R3C03_12980 [Pirellulaceae bacterium]
MKRSQRKTGTKVRDGRVTRKNRSELSNHYSQVRQAEPVIDRLRPGDGYKHYLTIADIKRFIGILPDWEQLSVGLDAVILAEGSSSAMGWHWDGVVAICAWERELRVDWDTSFVNEHLEILDRLGVKREPVQGDPDGTWCYFDDASIKGFQLMHIFLHELGHHRDRMTTKSKISSARGEQFAETYALKYADRLWDEYLKEFGW